MDDRLGLHTKRGRLYFGFKEQKTLWSGFLKWHVQPRDVWTGPPPITGSSSADFSKPFIFYFSFHSSTKEAEAGGPEFIGKGYMSLFSWNCRDSGGSTIITLNRYLHSTRALIAFIFETKCGLAMAGRRIDQLLLENSFVVPSEGLSGGLWLLWSNDVQVQVLSHCKHYIMAEVCFKDGKDSWGLVRIYGDPP